MLTVRLFLVIILLFVFLWILTYIQNDAAALLVPVGGNSYIEVTKNDISQPSVTQISDFKNSIMYNSHPGKYYDESKAKTNILHDNNWIQLLFNTSTNNQQNSMAYSSARQKHPIIVVQLGGQMGNYLSLIAHGVNIALRMYHNYGIMPKLVLRHKKIVRKWMVTDSIVPKCFPNLRQWNFSLGDTDVYDKRITKQQNNPRYAHLDMNGINSNDEQRVNQAIHNFVQLWTNATRNKDNASDDNLPILVSDYYALFGIFFDRYYEEIRQFLHFDEKACCGIRPKSDEIVFHYRNFLQELKGKGLELGFEDLGPKQVATQLFKNLKPKSKLAIVTAKLRKEDKAIKPYIAALRTHHHDVSVRVVPPQDGTKDFCFLMSTANVAVGNGKSTFFVLAMLLGNRTSNVRVYSIDSKYRRKRHGDDVFIRHDWKYAKHLQKRFHFELYKIEESYIPSQAKKVVKKKEHR